MQDYKSLYMVVMISATHLTHTDRQLFTCYIITSARWLKIHNIFVNITVHKQTESLSLCDSCNAMHNIAKAFLYIWLSVHQTHGLWQKKINLCPHSVKIIPHSFLTKKWLLGATPSTWNFRPNWPCWSENADFHSIL